MKVERKPNVIMTPEAYFRMMEYCRQAEGEVTGFGCVKEIGDTLFVDEVFIVPQKATGAGVQIDAQDLLDFMVYAKEQERPDWVTNAKLWWHSHAKFGVFRSQTDNDTIDMLLGMQPYVLAIVGNQAGAYECSLHYQKPRVSFTDLKIVQNNFDRKAIEAETREDIAAMVRKWERPAYSAPAYTPPAGVMKPPTQIRDFTEEDYLNSKLNKSEGRKSVMSMDDDEWARWCDEQGQASREG